jgi:hypothetical protein
MLFALLITSIYSYADLPFQFLPRNSYSPTTYPKVKSTWSRIHFKNQIFGHNPQNGKLMITLSRGRIACPIRKELFG